MLEEKWNLSKKELIQLEFIVFVQLSFSLFLSPKEALAQYLRVMKSLNEIKEEPKKKKKNKTKDSQIIID